VVVITAGGQITKGQSRDELVRINGEIIKEIISEIWKYVFMLN
jgi:malate/lactate dehydrogenase